MKKQQQREWSSQKRRVAVGMVAVTVMSVMAGCANNPAPSGETPPEELIEMTVGAGAVVPDLAQIWIADQGGYFEEAGLDVTIEVAGANVVNLVVSEQADIGIIGTSSALAVADQGKETSILYWNTGNGSGGFMAAREGVESPADCTRVSAQSMGTASYAYAVLYRKQFDASYEIIPTPDLSAVGAMITSEQVDCAVSVRSNFSKGIEEGSLHFVVNPDDPESLPRQVEVVSGAVWAMAENIADNREQFVAFMNAYGEAHDYMQSADPAEVAQLLRESEDWAAFDEETLAAQLEDTYAYLAPHAGYITPEAWDSTIDFFYNGGVEYLEPGTEKWSFDSRVDMSIYEEAIGKPAN